MLTAEHAPVGERDATDCCAAGRYSALQTSTSSAQDPRSNGRGIKQAGAYIDCSVSLEPDPGAPQPVPSRCKDYADGEKCHKGHSHEDTMNLQHAQAAGQHEMHGKSRAHMLQPEGASTAAQNMQL